jgi:hypothetical protein
MYRVYVFMFAHIHIYIYIYIYIYSVCVCVCVCVCVFLLIFSKKIRRAKIIFFFFSLIFSIIFFVSGRDVKYFEDAGLRVTGLDGCQEFCDMCKEVSCRVLFVFLYIFFTFFNLFLIQSFCDVCK